MRFKLNEQGVREIVQGDKAARFIERAADAVAQAVRDHAPNQDGRGFETTITRTDAERTANGQRITVFSTDIAAHIIEFGSINNPAYAPFRRAASAVGLRLRGGGERR